MEAFLGILLLAAFIGLYLLWDKAKGAVADRTASTLNRKIQPRRFQQGARETQETVHFTVQRSPDEFLHALRERLDLADEPALTSRLYPVAHTGDGFDIFCGTKLQTWFRYRVLLRPEAGGCQGTGTVLEWHKSEGLVIKSDEMARIRKALVAVAEENHGTATTAAPTEGTKS